ncbi:MAG: SSU rRNA (adenine(1518)-N(6)/adenine(1519)-N(6))-dimethyltransferase, partial [uncultured Blastococcus sp.]
AGPGRDPRARPAARPAPHQDARAELPARREHDPSDRPYRRAAPGRRRPRGRPRTGFPHARPASCRRRRGGGRDRPAAGRPAAGHGGRPSARAGRPADRGGGRRTADPRAARAAAHGAGGQPAVQHRGAGAAEPARAAPVAGPGPDPRAGRGRRAAGGPTGRIGLRRPVGEGRLVRRGPPRGRGRAEGLLARAQRRLGPGRPRPPCPAARGPVGDLRRRRCRVRHPAQGPARRAGPMGGQPGRRGGAAARRRHRSRHPRGEALGDRLRPAGGDRAGAAV